MAYQSNESGRFEIYLQPFPGPGTKVRISDNGGVQVRWRHDGKELFYLALDGQLVSVPLRFAPAHQPESESHVPMFFAHTGPLQDLSRHYVVSPHGRRFLIDTVVEEPAAPITIILNWKPPAD